MGESNAGGDNSRGQLGDGTMVDREEVAAVREGQVGATISWRAKDAIISRKGAFKKGKLAVTVVLRNKQNRIPISRSFSLRK